MPRRIRQPDTRPRWNDDLEIKWLGRWYSAEEWQRLCAQSMQQTLDGTINWKDDPSYNWNRRNKK